MGETWKKTTNRSNGNSNWEATPIYLQPNDTILNLNSLFSLKKKKTVFMLSLMKHVSSHCRGGTDISSLYGSGVGVFAI